MSLQITFIFIFEFSVLALIKVFVSNVSSDYIYFSFEWNNVYKIRIISLVSFLAKILIIQHKLSIANIN